MTAESLRNMVLNDASSQPDEPMESGDGIPDNDRTLVGDNWDDGGFIDGGGDDGGCDDDMDLHNPEYSCLMQEDNRVADDDNDDNLVMIGTSKADNFTG